MMKEGEYEVSRGNQEHSISAEYMPNVERQMRALLLILGILPNEIERIINAEEIGDQQTESNIQ